MESQGHADAQRPDGVWRLSAAIEPGTFEYQFYVDGVWHDDPSTLHKSALNQAA